MNLLLTKRNKQLRDKLLYMEGKKKTVLISVYEEVPKKNTSQKTATVTSNVKSHTASAFLNRKSILWCAPQLRNPNGGEDNCDKTKKRTKNCKKWSNIFPAIKVSKYYFL